MSPSVASSLPWLWATVVLSVAWRRRLRSNRLRDLLPTDASHERRSSPARRIGALCRAGAGLSEHPVADRRVGWTVIGAALSVLLSPVISVAVVALSIASAVAAEARRRRQAEHRVVSSLPDVIDLFVLVAGAGQPVRRSVQLVAARAAGPVGQELQLAWHRIEHGLRTADALERMADALGEPARPLVGVLCASERYGTPLVPALERLAAEARNDRRRRAEEAARRVPVKMLFPLVLCTLPAFALLTVVPLLISAFGSLRL